MERKAGAKRVGCSHDTLSITERLSLRVGTAKPYLFAQSSRANGHHAVFTDGDDSMVQLAPYYKEVIEAGGVVTLVVDEGVQDSLVNELGARVVPVGPNNEHSFVPLGLIKEREFRPLQERVEMEFLQGFWGGSRAAGRELVAKLGIVGREAAHVLHDHFSSNCPAYHPRHYPMFIGEPPAIDGNPVIAYVLSGDLSADEKMSYAYLIALWARDITKYRIPSQAPKILSLLTQGIKDLAHIGSPHKALFGRVSGLFREMRLYNTGVGVMNLPIINAPTSSPLYNIFANIPTYINVHDDSVVFVVERRLIVDD